MNKDEVIQSLIDLGLNTGEAKTYITLVLEGSSEATPLASVAGIPQPRIYEFLRGLSEKNLIIEYETNKRAKLYEAVDYNVALDLLEEELSKKVQSSRDYFKNNMDSAREEDQSLFMTRTGEKAIKVAVEDIFSKSEKNVAYFVNKHYAKMIDELMSKYKLEKFELVPSQEIMSIGKGRFGDLFDTFSKILKNFSYNHPSHLISDIDPERKTARLIATIIPRDDVLEPMILVVKHPLIIAYIIKIWTDGKQAIFSNLSKF